MTRLDDADRLGVAEWCQMAVDRVQAEQREASWLTATILVGMTLGYAANTRSRVPALAYALVTRTGYVLWFPGRASDVDNVTHLSEIERSG